jgi:hypothetical protein
MNEEFKGTSELDEWKQMTLASLERFFVDNCCEKCGCTQIDVTWQQVSVMSRDAAFEVKCCKCSFSKSATALLPIGSPVCWPLKNISPVVERLHKELELKRRQLQVVMQSMPAAIFATHSSWLEARWNATTYYWHPTSEVPPLIGLVFENQNAGLEIFRDALKTMKHMDPLDEIRISIIEGQVPGDESRPGYSIHISPDPDAVLGRATMNDLVMDSKLIPLFGQWNRHYPIPGVPSLLERFKDEYKRHGEFMLAPVVRRNDGQNYMDYRLGIVKKRIHFRKLHEIVDESDIDALAHVLPLFSAAPEI